MKSTTDAGTGDFVGTARWFWTAAAGWFSGFGGSAGRGKQACDKVEVEVGAMDESEEYMFLRFSGIACPKLASGLRASDGFRWLGVSKMVGMSSQAGASSRARPVLEVWPRPTRRCDYIHLLERTGNGC